MKLKFVLDDCVLLHALRGVNAWDIRDDSSGTFLGLLYYNCHSVIFTREIRQAFYRATNEGARLGRIGELLYPSVFTVLKQFLSASNKFVWVDPQTIVLEDSFPDEDDYLVRAALLARVDLITDDHELLEAVLASQQCKQQSVMAITPYDAIEKVASPD